MLDGRLLLLRFPVGTRLFARKGLVPCPHSIHHPNVSARAQNRRQRERQRAGKLPGSSADDDASCSAVGSDYSAPCASGAAAAFESSARRGSGVDESKPSAGELSSASTFSSRPASLLPPASRSLSSFSSSTSDSYVRGALPRPPAEATSLDFLSAAAVAAPAAALLRHSEQAAAAAAAHLRESAAARSLQAAGGGSDLSRASVHLPPQPQRTSRGAALESEFGSRDAASSKEAKAAQAGAPSHTGSLLADGGGVAPPAASLQAARTKEASDRSSAVSSVSSADVSHVMSSLPSTAPPALFAMLDTPGGPRALAAAARSLLTNNPILQHPGAPCHALLTQLAALASGGSSSSAAGSMLDVGLRGGICRGGSGSGGGVGQGSNTGAARSGSADGGGATAGGGGDSPASGGGGDDGSRGSVLSGCRGVSGIDGTMRGCGGPGDGMGSASVSRSMPPPPSRVAGPGARPPRSTRESSLGLVSAWNSPPKDWHGSESFSGSGASAGRKRWWDEEDEEGDVAAGGRISGNPLRREVSSEAVEVLSSQFFTGSQPAARAGGGAYGGSLYVRHSPQSDRASLFDGSSSDGGSWRHAVPRHLSSFSRTDAQPQEEQQQRPRTQGAPAVQTAAASAMEAADVPLRAKTSLPASEGEEGEQESLASQDVIKRQRMDRQERTEGERTAVEDADEDADEGANAGANEGDAEGPPIQSNERMRSAM